MEVQRKLGDGERREGKEERERMETCGKNVDGGTEGTGFEAEMRKKDGGRWREEERY